MNWTWWPAAGVAAFDWDWRAFPGVWLFVIAVALGQLWWARSGEYATGRSDRRRLYAAAGWVTLWLALDWPVGALAAAHLVSARTAQYLVLTFATVPLLLLGLSASNARAPSGAMRAMNMLSHPAVAVVVFAVVLGATHLPAVVDAASPRPVGVFATNMAWIVAATLFWWRVVGPEPDARRMPYLGVMVYLVVPFLLTKVPGLVYAFHGDPLYASFAAAPPAFGLAHGVDQQIAGFVLWFVGSALVIGALGVLFFRWQAEDRRFTAPDSLALPADPRALTLLFEVPGAWATLEAVVAGAAEALPSGTHGAELTFAYRESGPHGATQVVLELRIALDAERERALARQMERVVSECLGRLSPAARADVASRFAFRLASYGTRVG